MVVGIGAVAAGPVLHTDRLELRLPTAADMAAMMAIVSHPETSRYLGVVDGAPGNFARFTRNAGSWLLYGYGSFMVRRQDTGELIGNCGIFHSLRGLGADFDDLPEAGWILRHDHAGQGYAREAMEAVFGWFEHTQGPRRIVAIVEPGNSASLRLATKLGFTPMREDVLPDGADVRLLERLPR